MSKKKSNAATTFIVFFVVAVIIFIGVFIVASVLSEDEPAAVDRNIHYERMAVDVEWENDRSAKITHDLRVSFDVSGRHGIYYDIPVNSGEKIRNLKVNCSSPYSYSHESFNRVVRIKIGSENRTFSTGATLDVKISYDYITPVHSVSPDILALMAIGTGHTCKTNDATVTVTFPNAPDRTTQNNGIWISGEEVSNGDARVSWNADGTQVVIKAGKLEPFKGVEVVGQMPAGVLKNHVDTEFIVTLIVGLVLVAAAVLVKVLVRNKPVTPIVDFYPPRIDTRYGKKHMLPVQMGKIIDDTCSAEDVTSLIFYWANKGYIFIDERDDGIYLQNTTTAAMPRKKPIDPFDDSPVEAEQAVDGTMYKEFEPVTDYERTLFNALFSHAVTDEDGKRWVSIDSISGKFAESVKQAKTAVNKEYSGKLYKRSFTAISVVLAVACIIFAVCMCVFSTLRIGFLFFNPAGLIMFAPPLVALLVGWVLAKHHFKLENNKRLAFTVLFVTVIIGLSVGLTLLMPTDAMGIAEKLILGFSVGIASAIAPFLRIRTDFYNEQLNSILGFRTFLRDAEKDRLEALIESDPQYYYDILPYANVLGVSDVWQDKFKDLTVEPPTYYRSSNSNVLFDIYILSRLNTSISRSMTYVPPKTNSGSFSGGSFGGGGGGGGFSGGSFGGGGSGSW